MQLSHSGVSGTQGHSWVHREFEANLLYMTPSLKKQTSKQDMRKFRIGGNKTSSYISIVLRQGVAVGIEMAPIDPQGEPL